MSQSISSQDPLSHNLPNASLLSQQNNSLSRQRVCITVIITTLVVAILIALVATFGVIGLKYGAPIWCVQIGDALTLYGVRALLGLSVGYIVSCAIVSVGQFLWKPVTEKLETAILHNRNRPVNVIRPASLIKTQENGIAIFHINDQKGMKLFACHVSQSVGSKGNGVYVSLFKNVSNQALKYPRPNRVIPAQSYGCIMETTYSVFGLQLIRERRVVRPRTNDMSLVINQLRQNHDNARQDFPDVEYNLYFTAEF